MAQRLIIVAACGAIAAVGMNVRGAHAAQASPSEDDHLQRMQQQIDALKAQNEQQAGEIQQLRTDRGEQWLTEQRAAQIRAVVGDVLADSTSRAALQNSGAVAGYDKSFFLASADGNFKLNIVGQLQVRFAYNNVPTAAADMPTSQSANLYGFEVRRTKLWFSGHVIDPTWKYMVEISFERNGGASGGKELNLESAYVEKDLGGGTFIRFGEWLQQFNEEEMVGAAAQQFAERSLVNSYFTVKYVAGLEIGSQQEWWRVFGGINDGGNNRDVQVIQSANLVEWATTVRGELKFGGEWDQFRAYQGWIGSEFAVMIGAGLNWQRGTGVQGVRNTIGNGTIPGAPGGGEPASLLTYTGDFNMRASGWSFGVAGYGNLVYGFTPTAVLPGDVQSYAAKVQGGVFLTEQLELVARYEGLWVINGIANATTPNALNTQTLNIVTVGANYYFSKNRCKLTLDAGYAFNPVSFGSGLFGDAISGADWRPTLNAATAAGGGEGEVVVRSQLQLLF
ncbi:MAG: hypothetical protein JNK53_00795 [Phycisphaerae bacterium]|nr:hypothetical protein [Phycisphaerae bacterium]